MPRRHPKQPDVPAPGAPKTPPLPNPDTVEALEAFVFGELRTQPKGTLDVLVRRGVLVEAPRRALTRKGVSTLARESKTSSSALQALSDTPEGHHLDARLAAAALRATGYYVRLTPFRLKAVGYGTTTTATIRDNKVVVNVELKALLSRHLHGAPP